MSYDYTTERPRVFTEEGQVSLIRIRDNMMRHCRESGAIDFDHATKDCHASDSWLVLACLDRLVEMGEFECIWDKAMSQNRIYRRIGGQQK